MAKAKKKLTKKKSAKKSSTRAASATRSEDSVEHRDPTPPSPMSDTEKHAQEIATPLNDATPLEEPTKV